MSVLLRAVWAPPVACAVAVAVVVAQRSAIDVRAAAKRRDLLRSFTTHGATSPTSISSAVDFEREVMGGDPKVVPHIQPMCRCPIASNA
jgi:hypothetical protein